LLAFSEQLVPAASGLMLILAIDKVNKPPLRCGAGDAATGRAGPKTAERQAYPPWG